MLNDLFSQVPGEDEIDFSLFEDADDDNGEGLGALGRKRRKRRKTTARKRTRKRRTRKRRVSGLASTVKLSSLGRPRKRRKRSTRKYGVRRTAARAYTRKRRRRLRGVGSVGVARRRRRRALPRAVKRARRRYRRAGRKLRRANRRARVSTRRGQRRISRRRKAFRGLGRSRSLGLFSAKESMPVVGGFNWTLGTRDGRASLLGIAAGGFFSGLVEKVVFDRFLQNVEFLKDKPDGTVPFAKPILAAAISSIAGWEIGKLAKSKDFSKFAFLYPWGKLIENLVTAQAVEKIAEIGAKTGGNEGFGSIGQLRVPDSTELDGLGQLRIPDDLEGYGGMGQLRVPDLDMEGVEAGMGQYDIEESEDEESDVF